MSQIRLAEVNDTPDYIQGRNILTDGVSLCKNVSVGVKFFI